MPAASIARPRAQQLSLGLNAVVPRPALPQPSAPEVLQSSRVLLLHAFDTPQTRSRNLEAPPATAEAVGAGSASESGYSCSRDAGVGHGIATASGSSLPDSAYASARPEVRGPLVAKHCRPGRPWRTSIL